MIFGKSAGFDLDLLHGLCEGRLASEVPQELLVAQGLGGLGTKASGLMEGLNLAQQASLHHLLDALVDPRVDRFGLPVQTDQAAVGASG